MSQSNSSEKLEAGITIVYDGECPVCSRYVLMLRLKEAVGEVILEDGRTSGNFTKKATKIGLNLDEGMVVFYAGEVYHGDKAINILALLSSPIGVFNRVNAFIFRYKLLSRILYPILRFGRSSLLRILGRSKIEL